MNEFRERIKVFYYGGIVACIIAFGLWIAWVAQDWIVAKGGWNWEASARAEWGDSFGALNALFAAAAALGVVATLISQQKQITLTQEDQHRQQFDSSYFELLRLLDAARSNMFFRHSDDYLESIAAEEAESEKSNGTGDVTDTSGRSRKTKKTTYRKDRAIRRAWEEAQYFISMEGNYPSKEVSAAIYVIRVHNRYESSFSPYFRLLYTILNRIKTDTVLSNQEKVRYGNLLRSQLTSYELALCALNGLSEVSNDFDKLLTEFRLLKYLPRGQRRSFFEKYYPPETFLARD